MRAATMLLVLGVTGLLVLGLVVLDSASMATSVQHKHYQTLQVMWCGLGLLLGGIAAAVDYRRLQRVAWVLLAVAVILLVLVLVPGVGRLVKGARRWLWVGQPSEFAKLALILALAWYGARWRRHMHTFRIGLVLPGLMISLVLGLIFVEPDRGSTILLAGVSVVMLLLAGTRWYYLMPPICVSLAGLVWSLWNDPVRRERILAFLYPEQHKEGAGYQAWQAMLALGAGHWTGLGLGNGRQKLGFIPEHHTDFILSVIGEELGLVATLGVVVAFVVIVLCGLHIARHARDTFGFLLVSGLTFLIAFQAMINIGVVTSALPNKGLPLPFVSYGGSNLLLMMISVGLMLSVARQAVTGPSPSPIATDPTVLTSPEAS